MYESMYNLREIAEAVISVRNAWAKAGHGMQLEVMLRREIHTVSQTISRAELIERLAFTEYPLNYVDVLWTDYERAYYRFIRDTIGKTYGLAS